MMDRSNLVLTMRTAARRPQWQAALVLLAMLPVAPHDASGFDIPELCDSPSASVTEPATKTLPDGNSQREAIRELATRHRVLAPGELERVVDFILAEARAAGVDPLLVAAIVARESSFRTDAVSPRGAVGLMQIRPFVARDVAFRIDHPWEGRDTLFQADSNLRLGIVYFRELEARFDGDRKLALAAYHRGPTRLSRQLGSGLPIASRYADEVMALHAELSARGSQSPAPSRANRGIAGTGS